MLLVISEKIASFFCGKGLLESNEYDWIVYTLQGILSTTVGLISLVLTGLLLSGLTGMLYALAFIGGFWLIRRHAGGYHAKTPLGCFALTLGSFGLTQYVLVPVLRQYLDAVPIIAMAAVLLLYFIGTVPHPNLPMDVAQVAIKTLQLRRNTVITFIAVLVLCRFSAATAMALNMSIAICFSAVSSLVGKSYYGRNVECKNQ